MFENAVMSLPFTFLPRAVIFEPVYLVRFKLQEFIQLRLRALIEVHNQVFPAPKIGEYIGRLCELEAFDCRANDENDFPN